MSLTIVTGPAQAGKTQVCLAALSEHVPAEIVLVCSTTYLADSLGRRLAMRRPQTTRQITTTTFRELTRKLWGLHGDRRALIGAAAREAIVDELLARLSDKEATKSLQTAGGRRLLTELVQICTLPETQLSGAHPSAILRRSVERYQARIEAKGLIERDAALTDLAQRHCAADAAYAFLGFTDFTPAQRAYVEMLCARTDVAVAITCEPTGEATREGRCFAEELAGESSRQIAVPAAASEGPAGDLALLRAGFLSEDIEVSSTALRSVAAQGDDEEIVAAVQAVREAKEAISLQSNKVSEPTTDDAPVALIFRHLGAKITQVAQTLDANGIPAAFDLKIPFRQAGLGAALYALMSLPSAGDDLPRITSGYLLSAYSGKTQDEAARIEQALREKRRAYSRELCMDLGVPVLSSLDAKGWAQLATVLLFRGARIPRNDYLSQLDFAAHKAFLTLLDELRELGQDADASAILARLTTTSIELTPPAGSTRVLVSEASRVRGRQFHTVVLAGLAQQDFSAPAEPSVSERIAAQITGRPDPDSIAGEHQLWYDLLGCARASLVLIAQSRDLSGQELPPSAFLEEIVRMSASGSVQESRRETATVPAAASSAPPERGQLTGLDFGPPARPPFAITTLESYARCPYAWFLGRFVARRRIREDTDAQNEGLILHEALRRFYERTPSELGEAHVRSSTLGQAHKLLDHCFDEAWQEKLGASSTAQLPDATQVSLASLRRSLHDFLDSEVDRSPGFEPRYLELPFGEGDAPAPLVGGVPVRGRIDRIDVCGSVPPGALFVIDYKRSVVSGGGGLTARYNNREIQATAYSLVAGQLLAPLRPVGSAYRSILDPRINKVEHRKSARLSLAEQLGFPSDLRSAPRPIDDEPPEDGSPSDYEQGIAGIEALVSAAAEGLSCGNIPITPARKKDGEPKKPCPWARDCLHQTCPYRRTDGSSS